MHNDDPGAVDVMLRYLYTLDTSTCNYGSNTPKPVLRRLWVLQLADKYNIVPLAILTLRKLQDGIGGLVSESDAEEHADLVRAVWADDAPAIFYKLRSILVIVGTGIGGDEDFRSQRTQLMRDCPDYAVELVEKLRKGLDAYAEGREHETFLYTPTSSPDHAAGDTT